MGANPIRTRILTRGLGIASSQGLTALTMGTLARELELPRSGLVDHFADRESLQLGVLEQATEMFMRDVVDASRSAPAGEAQLKLLKGGCPFVHASRQAQELPEPVRTRLKQVLDGWSEIVTNAIRDAKQLGQFRANVDAEQMLFEMYGLYLSHHFFYWYMKDAAAESRTLKAFERLLTSNH